MVVYFLSHKNSVHIILVNIKKITNSTGQKKDMGERGGHWGFRFCGFGQFLIRFFGFGVSCGLRVFSNLTFGFRFLSKMMAVFRILLPNSFYGFSGFAKEVTHTLQSR